MAWDWCKQNKIDSGTDAFQEKLKNLKNKTKKNLQVWCPPPKGGADHLPPCFIVPSSDEARR